VIFYRFLLEILIIRKFQSPALLGNNAFLFAQEQKIYNFRKMSKCAKQKRMK